jgi:hypothetical protein
MTTYRIRITKNEESLCNINEYQKIADTGNEKDGKSIYGYVPVEKLQRMETDVLDIVVGDLKMNNVLQAIMDNSENV